MYKPFIAFTCLAACLFAASVRAQTPSAQEQAAMDDQTAMRQAIQPLMQTIMQNMNDKGIDPRQFFQQMQNGTDPADMEKQLIDQGLIDRRTLDDVRTNVLAIQARSYKRQLDVTDDEWKTLWPLVEKVMKASAALNGTRGQMGGMGAFMMGAPPKSSELTLASKALRMALKDPATPAEQFSTVLKDYRNARVQAQADLDAARKELVGALSVRQEAVLASLGVIE